MGTLYIKPKIVKFSKILGYIWLIKYYCNKLKKKLKSTFKKPFTKREKGFNYWKVTKRFNYKVNVFLNWKRIWTFELKKKGVIPAFL
jgi:hypothetical protein